MCYGDVSRSPLPWLENAIREYGVSLVIVDTMGKFMCGAVKDENSYFELMRDAKPQGTVMRGPTRLLTIAGALLGAAFHLATVGAALSTFCRVAGLFSTSRSMRTFGFVSSREQ